jgi:hypothetical protein
MNTDAKPRRSNSNTRNRHRMVCRACRREGRSKRFTLRRHPDNYARTVKCPRCKSFDVRSDETTRRKEIAKRVICHCGSPPFPHEKGSMRFCDHHPLIDVEGTKQEYLDWQAMMDTPRGGGL